MADTSEQPAQEISAKVEEISVNDAKLNTKPAASPRTGFLFPIIILLLLFGIAGGGFYLISQLRDKQEGLGGEVKGELAKQITDYQKQLTAIQQNISTLQAELNGKDQHFNKILSDFSGLHQQKMESTRKELSDKVLQVQRQLGKTRGDWLIADAEYLLSVANERLHLIGDVNTTREALTAADQRLRESGDTGIIQIREQIAKELSLLKDINPPDIVGLYASVQALEGEVSKLALNLPYSGKPLTPAEEATNSSAVSEENNELLNSAIRELEGIVTIKHSEKPVKEILTQEQADFIREQLKVKLESVKFALVHQNDELYQLSLKDLKAWSELHFTNNEVFGKFKDELSRLQTIKLRSQFPDISLSLKMLRDISKLRIETDKTLESSEPGNQIMTEGAKSANVNVSPAENPDAALNNPVGSSDPAKKTQ